jgi:hypothetical protein
LHSKPGRVPGEVCPGYKYKSDIILFPSIGFGPGFEYKPLDEFRDLKCCKTVLQNIFRDLSAARQPHGPKLKDIPGSVPQTTIVPSPLFGDIGVKRTTEEQQKLPYYPHPN